MKLRVYVLLFTICGQHYFVNAQSHKTLFNRGKEAYEAGNYIEAVPLFDQAIAKNKTNTPVSLQSMVTYKNWRGAAHAQLGNFSDAVRDLTYAIQNRKIFQNNKWLPDKSLSDFYWRGYSQRMQEKYSIALDDFNQVLEIDPNHGSGHFNKGMTLLGLKDYQNAIKNLDKALLNGYDHSVVYENKGVCYYRLQNYQMALSNYTRAYELNNKDLASLSGQALSRAHMGQYGLASELIDRAINNSEGKNNYFFFQKARIEALFGNDEAMLENMEKSFALGFNNWQSLSVYLPEFGSYIEDPRFIQLLIDNEAQVGLMGTSSETNLITKINQQRNQNLSYTELKANPTKNNDNDNSINSSETKKPFIKSDIDDNIPNIGNQNINYFAVVIGNENYNNEITVSYAINDARSFKNYLQKTVGIPESNIHYVEDATYGQLLDEIDWISKIIDAFQQDARIFFYYAGHGVPDDETKDAFLLPTDGNSTRTNTAISLNSLYASLTAKNASSVTVFLDACFSGASREGMLTEGRGVRIKPKEADIAGNLVVFSAATGDQTAYPLPDQGHGLFTYFLLKKLQETNGKATYGELADYLKAKVNQKAVVINGKNQNPQINTSPQFPNWDQLKFE